MREIKFRGKSVMTGDWVYGSHLLNSAGKETFHQIVTSGGMIVKVDSDTVGQYVEFNDKNGVEIFEEDIIKLSLEDYSGVPDPQLFIIRSEAFPYDVAYLSNIDQHINDGDTGDYIEIIGNKHDNPDLLGDEEDALYTTNV